MQKNLLHRIACRAGRLYPFLPALLAVNVLLYGKTLAFRFTHFDDDTLILNNQEFLGNAAGAVSSFFTSLGGAFSGFYRPLLNVSFIVDAALGGADPFAYHLSNVLFHAAAAWVLFLVLRELKFGALLSLCCALVFSVHPALAQAVAWIPGRNDSLLALFVMGSFLFLLRYSRSGRRRHYVPHLLFAALALFTKETAVMQFVVFALYVFLYTHEFAAGTARKLWRGWLPVVALWAALATHALHFGNGHFALPDGLRTLTAFVYYVGTMVFPVHLSPLLAYGDMTVAWGIAALALLAAAVLYAGDRRLVLFSFAWLACFLLPPLLLSGMNCEHRVYVPLAGLCFVLAAAGRNLAGAGAAGRKAAAVFGAVAVTALLCKSFVYSDIFMNRETFYRNAVALSPRSEHAYEGLGNYYRDCGMYAQAVAAYQKAIALAPGYVEPYFNLAEAYRAQGDLAGAERYYRVIIAKDPGHVQAHVNLAAMYADAGRLDEAAAHLTNLVRNAPGVAFGRYNLGNIYFRQQRYGEAVEEYRRAIALAPRYDADSHYNIAAAYYRLGRTGEALRELEGIVAARPDFSDARRFLAGLRERSASNNVLSAGGSGR